VGHFSMILPRKQGFNNICVVYKMVATGRSSNSFANYAKNNGFRAAERLDYEDVGPGQDYVIIPKQHDGDYSSNPVKDVLSIAGIGVGLAAPFVGGLAQPAAQLGALGTLSDLTARALGATNDNGITPGLYEQGSHGKSRASYEKDQANAMVTDYESKAVDSIQPEDLHSAPTPTAPEPAPQSIVHNAPTYQPQPQQSYEVPKEQAPRDTSYYDQQPSVHNYVQPQPTPRVGGLGFNGGPKQKIGKTIRPKKKKSNKKK